MLIPINTMQDKVKNIGEANSKTYKVIVTAKSL